MRGCGLARGWIALEIDQSLAPRNALDLARHLSDCPNCAEERARLLALERELDQLPQAHVPSGFASRVMRRIRSVSPALRRMGACLLLAIAMTAGAVALRPPLGQTDLLPTLRLAWDETLQTAVVGFGRAMLVVLAEAVSGQGLPTWSAPAYGAHTVVSVAPLT
jgi:anti-sigma factor RsiW